MLSCSNGPNNVAAEYAALRLHVIALGGDCNKVAISINATSRALALKSCITAAPPMIFTRRSRVRAGVLQLHQAYISKTQVATEITACKRTLPKEFHSNRVLPILRLWINNHTPMTMKLLHDRADDLLSCIKPKFPPRAARGRVNGALRRAPDPGPISSPDVGRALVFDALHRMN